MAARHTLSYFVNKSRLNRVKENGRYTKKLEFTSTALRGAAFGSETFRKFALDGKTMTGRQFGQLKVELRSQERRAKFFQNAVENYADHGKDMREFIESVDKAARYRSRDFRRKTDQVQIELNKLIDKLMDSVPSTVDLIMYYTKSEDAAWVDATNIVKQKDRALAHYYAVLISADTADEREDRIIAELKRQADPEGHQGIDLSDVPF